MGNKLPYYNKPLNNKYNRFLSDNNMLADSNNKLLCINNNNNNLHCNNKLQPQCNSNKLSISRSQFRASRSNSICLSNNRSQCNRNNFSNNPCSSSPSLDSSLSSSSARCQTLSRSKLHNNQLQLLLDPNYSNSKGRKT